MGEIDVRRLMSAITYAELVAWARYLQAKDAPAKAWIRDPDQIERMAAMIYG